VLREPIHLCTCVNKEGDDGEAVCSETTSLLKEKMKDVLFVIPGFLLLHDVSSRYETSLELDFHLVSFRVYMEELSASFNTQDQVPDDSYVQDRRCVKKRRGHLPLIGQCNLTLCVAGGQKLLVCKNWELVGIKWCRASVCYFMCIF
jgi:hypothetical protein